MPKTTATCAALAGVFAVLGGVAGVAHSAALTGLGAGLTGITINTAIALLLLALAWFVPRRVGLLLAGFVVVFGAAALLDNAAGGLGIDQLLADDSSHADADPGRPPVVTCVTLILLGSVRLLAHVGRPRSTQSVSLLVLLSSALTVLGFAFGVDSLHRARPVTSVALPTALATALLSIAALASVENGMLTWAVHGRDAGAELVRRLLPLALVGLPVLGFGCLLAQRHGTVNGGATLVLFVVACALAVGVLTWAAARRLERMDQRRQQTVAELFELKDDLARQVDERAAQVERRGGQIAVLEDRQRIAADLHDIVIQRLFAAGMFLQSGATAHADQATRDRINTAVEAMDAAIKDLRNSIFELGGRRGAPVDLTSAVDLLCIEASRILGFLPDLVVDDPDCRAEAMREDVLAVTRESLANVAKHAEATHVEVVLRADNGFVTLSVTDDGRGMGTITHFSGTRNVTDRAQRRGGNCSWEDVAPCGTRVCWTVPLPD